MSEFIGSNSNHGKELKIALLYFNEILREVAEKLILRKYNDNTYEEILMTLRQKNMESCGTIYDEKVCLIRMGLDELIGEILKRSDKLIKLSQNTEDQEAVLA